jgi:Protein of unknown function (DUF3237)
MIELEYEMTYREQIEGPLAPTKGSPFGERLCWQVVSGTLVGPRINAKIAMPGIDWMRLGTDGIRRQDLRVQLVTVDDTVILFHYDVALIRSNDTFLDALAKGSETSWSDQYMRIIPEFDVGAGAYSWLTESLFIGEGRLAGPKEIEYAIYRVA